MCHANTQSATYAISLMENFQRKKLIHFKFDGRNLTPTKFQGQKVYVSHNLIMKIIITLRLWFSILLFWSCYVVIGKAIRGLGTTSLLEPYAIFHKKGYTIQSSTKE